jgi:hypothetical protein
MLAQQQPKIVGGSGGWIGNFSVLERFLGRIQLDELL